GRAEDQVQDEVAYEIPLTGNASATGVALKTGLKKESTHGRKSIASMGLDAGSLLSTPDAQDPSTATKSVSDPEPLSYANPLLHLEKDIARSSATEILTEDAATAEVNIQFSVGSLESGRSSLVPSMVGSPGGIYQPRWGVTNDCRLDALDACQDIVNHIAPSGYFSKLRHFPNAYFLDNITLEQQVAMGSQLRLRFVQKVRLLKKARSKIAKRDQRIQLEAEVDMRKSAKAKSAELTKELDSLRAQFSDLQVSNKQLSDQVLNLQARVMGEENIKAASEEFKKHEDDKVEQRDRGLSLGHWARPASCRYEMCRIFRDKAGVC
nr:hypothetical protein [Tanacetum cinerariifolium]